MTHQHEVQPCLYKCSACERTASSPNNIVHDTGCALVKQEKDKEASSVISDTLSEIMRVNDVSFKGWPGTVIVAEFILDALKAKGHIK